MATPVSEGRTYDWRFARRPFWIFSHIFAATVIISFIALGFWQLNRHGARQDQNALVETRLSEAIELTAAPDSGDDGSDLDYRSATATVRFVDADFVRVGNRSQGGAAGEHVVAIVELEDGSMLAVNRGFVPANVEVTLDPVPDGSVTISGWLRASVTKGSIGATDSGEGTVLPRLDTERVAFRLGEALPNVWLQVSRTARPVWRRSPIRPAATDRRRPSPELRGAVVHLRNARHDLLRRSAAPPGQR